MKKFYLLTTLLIVFAGSLFSNHKHEFLEGKYFNRAYGIDIKVKSTRAGVKVKGLPGRRGYVHFFQAQRGHFFETHGPSIISFYGRNEVVFKRTRRSRSLSFIKKDNRGHQYRFYNDKNGRRNNSYYLPQKEPRGRDNIWENEDFGNDHYSIRKSIIGEWYSNDLRKLVIIEEHEYGIKARLSGDKKWTEYEPLSRETFIDKKGNTYSLNRSDQLVWKDSKGKNTYILFRS
jgi:hypothetical protein